MSNDSEQLASPEQLHAEMTRSDHSTDGDAAGAGGAVSGDDAAED